jgi:hypothetical protein
MPKRPVANLSALAGPPSGMPLALIYAAPRLLNKDEFDWRLVAVSSMTKTEFTWQVGMSFPSSPR